MGSTLYDKLWARHVVLQRPGHPAALYIDLHLVHEGTYLQAFQTLRERGLPVRRLPLTVATTDHFVPTDPASRVTGLIGRMPYVVKGLTDTAAEFGMRVYGPNHERQGIVHVIGPELGLTLPGMTVVCGDSHTSTHGALGALAFGIGTTQVGHVLATQCLLQVKQRNLRVTVTGSLGDGVMAKDLALHLLAGHGVEYGRGHVIEFAGEAIERLPMSERMSLCNMSIEMGARSAVIAPDDTTIDYVEGRPHAPAGADWDQAVSWWRTLRSDPDARFDREIDVAAADVQPMVTYGTTPAMGTTVTGTVPDGPPDDQRSYAQALAYMGMRPGDALIGKRVRTVFIGSCTNSRIEDLRAAAGVLRDHTVAEHTELRVVPGSQAVKRQAEAEGLADVFRAAGALWGEPSCSMCLGVNGDIAPAGELVASTSNRNFEGRQGPDARTLLMSPLTAAATAIAGSVADPRPYLRRA
jgi:3-isopropylmalate/(R)-2-methylmalate dehydratase large subunit